MTTEEQQLKLCRNCNVVKNLHSDYYKAGKGFQKYCIPCHNSKRYEYTQTYKYEKKPKGFKKLSQETRENILNDIKVRINFKEISNKYNIKYATILCWKRNGLLN
jgi:hypothetical protein